MIKSGKDIHKKPLFELVQGLSGNWAKRIPARPEVSDQTTCPLVQIRVLVSEGPDKGSDRVQPATETTSGWTYRLR